MSNYVECPFCGIYFPPYPHEALTAHPPNASDEVQCPLVTFVFTKKQWDMRPAKKPWDMRPPKKEIGHIPKSTQDEVEWLRAMVERVMLQKSVAFKPSEIMDRGE